MDENGYPISGYRLRYAHAEDMVDAVEAVPTVVLALGSALTVLLGFSCYGAWNAYGFMDDLFKKNLIS